MKATFPLSTVKSKFKPISRYCTWSQSNQFGLKFSHTQTNTSYVFLGEYEEWYFFLSYIWCDPLIKFIIRSTINMRGWNTISPYLRNKKSIRIFQLALFLLSALLPCTFVRILIGRENQFSWMLSLTPLFTFIYNIFNQKKR